MPDLAPRPFLAFLASGSEKGGFETDDVLAVMLPLMKQVLAAHQTAMVAPLCGVGDLIVGENGALSFAPEKLAPRKKNSGKIEAVQRPLMTAVQVVGQKRRTSDIDQSSVTVSDLEIASSDAEITKPAYLLNYKSWEHAVGHHDELTDIFSLGMLLASVACALDFSHHDELELFTTNRTHLFAVGPRLNPVVASVIVQMTELNRHKRAPDLAQMISRLENYREQTTETDFKRLKGFKESNLTGKRRVIQSHLRDRLFEISRRNRLIYFKPSMQTLNLTVASVPLVLDYRNIKLEQLFVWHEQLASIISDGSALTLGKYLRFEDAPYIPGVLDKIISEARRDRAEYGFAQLRLVLCFLRWNNLKEDKHERIHSPLLLLPVELTRKKGVRDNYVLQPTSSEAEVNPALRHHLKELYNLNLPEFVDLKETKLDAFFDLLRAQIHASEPGVVLNKIDRPQIDLIHEKARQRVDQYRRRMKLQAKRERKAAKPDYSYDRENFRPLGLQLFLEKIRPTPLPLRQVAGAAPEARLPHIVESAQSDPGVIETERQMFSLRDGQNQNPYSWDFDLCTMTLGNFNYRKMTLVRDYSRLIETDLASTAFDQVFSLTPKAPEEASLPGLEIADMNLVIPCDATQASAIARARTGTSYIIQGPPGTGKSQTITNLIADYAARGKRVLFVCEKRAAIDVVFHRLRQQGLDELCCLIHDSQTDKKAFIQNLKQTYEKFLNPADVDADAERLRTVTVRSMDQELAALRRFSDAMRQAHTHTGIPVRSLLRRLVEVRGHAQELPPEVEDLFPDYPLWMQHGDVVDRLRSALADLGEDLHFKKLSLRLLAPGILQADKPIEKLSKQVARAEELLDAVESAMELSGLPEDSWSTLERLRSVFAFVSRAQMVAQCELLRTVVSGPEAKAFDKIAEQLDANAKKLATANDKLDGWREKLSRDDTQSALALAQAYEKSIFKFLQPSYWRLRKTLRSHYDFSKHAVEPAWTKILKDLAAFHEADAANNETSTEARRAWKTEDLPALRVCVGELREQLRSGTAVAKALSEKISSSDGGAELMGSLSDAARQFAELDETLRGTLVDHERFGFRELVDVLADLRDETGLLAELMPVLNDIANLPESFASTLRRADLPLNEFEGAIGHKSLNHVYRQDRAVGRFDGRLAARKMEQLEKQYRDWLQLNARAIRAKVRQKFLDHVNVASQPASQLTAEQKEFKKSYSAGRRELEHEFGKSMRYKSIRELAGDESGQVIQDLKPIWLMSPLSVSDTLPLDPDLFDVVIFDEASQVPVEEAIPAVYRAHQVIVVGDEMQLPPTTFFASTRSEDETVVVEEEGERIEVDLDSDSFLTQSAQNLPSTMLAWHYRSRYEALISFSNAAFYSGNLFTIPDRQRLLESQTEINVTDVHQGAGNVDALLARSISFHFMQNGVYESRTNPNEAAYIAQLVRELLARETKLSIGIVAFSEAQQTEIESALSQLAREDSAFEDRLETEYVREENDVFCGLFVKNLENVQGDERDIIIMSVCYGYDASGRMLMNFGPINQRGGEKRLNVIFSRAKHHMAIVSSIRHEAITNDYNDGANSLKNFLHFAEAVSRGDAATARRVLENLNPLSRKGLEPVSSGDAVVQSLAEKLRARGFAVDINVGQSKFRCDLAVRTESDSLYQLGILVDTDGHYANPNLLDRYLMQPTILRAFGWKFALVLTKDWYHDPEQVLTRIERLVKGIDTGESPTDDDDGAGDVAEEPANVAPVQPAPTPGLPAVPVPAAQSPNATATSARYFEFVSGSSQKFWEISVAGCSFTVRFGKIGTSGQTQTKTFADEITAKNQAERLVSEKVKKGYVEKR
jgi:predicted DNA-binding WGR domain protein